MVGGVGLDVVGEFFFLRDSKGHFWEEQGDFLCIMYETGDFDD